MSAALSLLAMVALAYVAGSFPTSIIIGKLFFHKDIRAEGSGNAGGTNSFRVFGWKAGLAVVVVDVGKGALAALLISRLGAPSGLPVEALRLLGGLAAVVGHVWTVFAGFRGGKGVATAAGALIAAAPLPAAGAGLVFALVLFTTGIVSLGSIAAACAFPAWILLLGLAGLPVSPVLLGFGLLLAPLIAFTHRANIGRLRRGEEKRFENLRLFKKRS
ncbi:MAG: glycerol-3-phosphate 1-O-acyltransferase PlsY [Spirochaetaceae bacterium]|nr:glycerol-3-phosphate 1-O-acyltransferase PlsY [Spirochaetaceae bacterium]